MAAFPASASFPAIAASSKSCKFCAFSLHHLQPPVSSFCSATQGMEWDAMMLLTLFPRRGLPRALSPPRGTFRPPLWASGEGPGGSRGCPRTARTRTRWPGVARDKRSTFCHVLSRWRVGREEGRKRHSQTLNLDLSLPDRGPELGLESTHKARGPGAEARHRRRSLVVEPDLAGEATSNPRGAYVKTTFSSASRSASAAERSDIPRRSPSLPGHRPARRSHHPRADLTNRRRIEIL